MMKTATQRVFSRWPFMIWLALVWVFLWGDWSWANIIAGFAVAMFLLTITPMPPSGWEGRLWLPGLVILVVKFLWDVAVASFQIAIQAIRFGYYPRPGVVRVKLRSNSDVFLTITSQLCCLVPGSLTVEAHRLSGTLYMHVFDIPQMGGAEAARKVVLDQEKRILYAFATDAAIAEAGLAPRWGRARKQQGAKAA